MENQAQNITPNDEIHSADGWVEIAVADDGLIARVNKIVRHTGDGKPINVSDILNRLKQLKVTHGIDQEAIENLIKSVNNNILPEEPVVIAKGDVENGSIEWCIEGITEKDSAFLVVPKVKIVVWTLATQGKKGKDVFGEPISLRPGFDQQLINGSGVVYSQETDGVLIYESSYTGMLRYKSGKLSIDSGLTISEDKLQVHMDIYAGKVTGLEKEVTETNILDTLEAVGIKQGINADQIKSSLEEARKSGGVVKNVLVAEGLLAKDGVDTRIEFDKEFSACGKILPNGRVDCLEKSYPWNVKVNDVIGKVIPGQCSEDGRNVIGEVLIANQIEVSEPELEGIKNEANGTLHVTEDGILLVNGIHLKISDCLELEGDVCQQTGNIHSDKSVNVKGFVESSFILETKGDAIIQQNVENATVSANGSVVIKSGIRGAHSKIISGGDLTAAFAENADLNVKGDIIITNSVINCHTVCQGTMHVGDAKSRKSAIQGDTTRAFKGVEVAILGSDSFNKTLVEVGAGSDALTRLKKIVNDICKIEKGITDLEQVYEHYYNNLTSQESQEELKKLNVLLRKLTDTRDHKNNVYNELFEEKETIQNSIVVSKDVKVIVHERVYPGVDILILDKRYEVKEERGSGVFHLKGGKIIFESH